VLKFCQLICSQRGDLNGRVLTLRGSDLTPLTLAVGAESGPELLDALQNAGVVPTGGRLAELTAGAGAR
jgi:hypothetical protein